MDVKRIMLITLIILAILASVSVVSAGWFDFLSDDSSQYSDNPISAPNNANKITLNDSLSELNIYSGEGVEIAKVHTTDNSGKSRFNYLSMEGEVNIDYDDLQDNSLKSVIDKIYHDVKDYDSPVEVSDQEKVDEMPLFTAPSNDTGGIYLELFDKNNESILKKNVYITQNRIDEHKQSKTFGEDRLANTCDLAIGLTEAAANKDKQMDIEFAWFIDITDNPDILETVKKADHAEVHMLLIDNETGPDNCYDLCIPIDEFEMSLDTDLSDKFPIAL